MKYARLTYLDAGKRRTVLLQTSGEFRQTRAGQTLTGVKVDKDGARTEPLHVFLLAPEDVVKVVPLEMDLFYGEFVREGTATRMEPPS